jgi:16S rRNA processing protein RimM
MNRRRKINPVNPENDAAGSRDSGEPVFLVVGRLRRTHGVRGEILFEPLTDFPERIQPGKVLYLGDEKRPFKVKSQRPHDTLMILGFEEIQDMDQAGQLRNQLVYVRKDSLPALPDGEYYHHDLLGCRVISEDGSVLGVLAEILQTGANDVYLVRDEVGNEILLPVIPDVIVGVDIERKEVRVRPLEWE